MQLWLQTWGLPAQAQRLELKPGDNLVPDGYTGPLLLCCSRGRIPLVDGQHDVPMLLTLLPGGRDQLVLLPAPVSRSTGLKLRIEGEDICLLWRALPDRPSRTDTLAGGDDSGQRLMQRARAVWDMLSDVDQALRDPATLWQALCASWTGAGTGEPRMHVIVRQARRFARVLDSLESRPRRVLRRVHQRLPIARVAEVDRPAMMWLARQPGETLAERAGETQRLLAVARTENFDVLENRVLRAYAELAARAGRDYLQRYSGGVHKGAARICLVAGFVRRCQRLARTLAAAGVRVADPHMAPNFALQHNVLYREIWRGWRDLMQRSRIEDDLWRWQARSWEEYCSLLVMIALVSMPGVVVVAATALRFRDEQNRGCWVDMGPLLGVFYAQKENLVVEVLRKWAITDIKAGVNHTWCGLMAPIWLRISRVEQTRRSQVQVPVWAAWAPNGGLVESDEAEIRSLLPVSDSARRPAIVLRPAVGSGTEDFDTLQKNDVLTLAVGTDPAVLQRCLCVLQRFLGDVFGRARA